MGGRRETVLLAVSFLLRSWAIGGGRGRCGVGGISNDTIHDNCVRTRRSCASLREGGGGGCVSTQDYDPKDTFNA